MRRRRHVRRDDAVCGGNGLAAKRARGGRFFVLAVLLNRYGDVIRAELEKRLGLWVVIGTVVLVGGFYIAYRLV